MRFTEGTTEHTINNVVNNQHRLINGQLAAIGPSGGVIRFLPMTFKMDQAPCHIPTGGPQQGLGNHKR